MTFSSARLSGWRAFVLYSNVHVGGVAVALLLGNYALLGIPPDGPLLLLAFAGAVLIYQVDRTAYASPEDSENEPDRGTWLTRHRTIVRGSMIVAALILITLASFVRFSTLAVGGGLGLLGLLYAAPILPGRRSLKGIWYVKPVLIVGAWAVGSAVLPVLETGCNIEFGTWALAVYRALYILPNVLIADWHDRHGDRQSGLRSPATVMSLDRLRTVGLGSCLVTLCGSLLFVAFGDAPALLMLDALGAVLVFFAVFRMADAGVWFYGFWIDAMVAWPFVTWVVSRWLR